MEQAPAWLHDPLVYIPELFKVIDKHGNLVSMKLKPLQEHYIRNRSTRDLILKGRQVTMSTGVLAANSHILFTRPYQRMAIITHDSETSEFLLQNVHRFHRNLPEDMRPQIDWSSSIRIRLPILDNYIYIDSAKSDSMGIGHTLNIVHLSELARWPDGKARQLWADITQTVPLDGFLTAESTPRGRVGLFYELWSAASKKEIPYKTFFYPWWWEPDYTLPVDNPLKLTREEEIIVESYKLSPGQIAWRRLKQSELGPLFYQEFPESEVQCWLANDIGVVDPLYLQPYWPMIKDGTKEGNLTTWKGPVGGRRYVMGVDTSAGYATGDFSAACVLDVRTMEYVARLWGHEPPDIFAEHVFQLGRKYNDALIAVEKVGHGHTVLRILLEKDYPNLYYRSEYDDIGHGSITEVGWHTNVKTKPEMITGLVAAFRSQDLISWSGNLLKEASSLIWETDRKVKKTGGVDDDEWDALSIAIQVREQSPIIEEQRAAVTYYA